MGRGKGREKEGKERKEKKRGRGRDMLGEFFLTIGPAGYRWQRLHIYLPPPYQPSR